MRQSRRRSPGIRIRNLLNHRHSTGILIITLILLSGFLLLFPSLQKVVIRKTSKQSISVCTYNTGNAPGDHPDAAQAAEVLLSRGVPDIILLQEISSVIYVDTLTEDLNNMTGHFYQNQILMDFRMATLSRYPVISQEYYLTPDMGIAYGVHECIINVDDTPISVINVHLTTIPKKRTAGGYVDLQSNPPLRIVLNEMFGKTRRSDQVDSILTWLKSRPIEHRIIAGDFNTIPYTKPVRSMEKEYTEALEFGVQYFRGSYMKVNFIIHPRVDYVFFNQGFRSIEGSIGEFTYGDHYPVYAELSIR